MVKFHHKLISFIEILKQHMKSNMLSSENTENEVLTITYEPPSSEDNFERKFQEHFSPSDKSFERK